MASDLEQTGSVEYLLFRFLEQDIATKVDGRFATVVTAAIQVGLVYYNFLRIRRILSLPFFC